MEGGVTPREAVSAIHTHTHIQSERGPAGSSEDRDRPELNSTLQIAAAVFQVEQSGGAPHR